MKKYIILILTICFIPTSLHAEELPAMPSGPMMLTSVTPNQLNANYWIKRLPNPDKPVKTPAQMKAFNEEIHMMIADRVDVFKIEQRRYAKPIKEQLEKDYRMLKKRAFYGVDNKRIPDSLFEDKIKGVMNWEVIPSNIKMKWGSAVTATGVRALPTTVKMLEKKNDPEFDQLQFTLIKTWTPVGIFHTSKDGKWYYVQAPYTRGWVRSKDIAIFGDRDSLKKYVKQEKPLVVTGESVPVFSETSFQTVLDRPSMGTVFPLIEKTAAYYSVRIPRRNADGSVSVKTGYISSRVDVAIGHLPFTQRNVINQAFKLLGARYGWGGTYKGRDCSGFTHDVFLSLGVDMPRDSKSQSFVGTQVNNFDIFLDKEQKILTLNSAIPGITLLRMPMHMMLYLGRIQDRHYIIHSTWAERTSMVDDTKNRINQVVVSDLSLNGNSYLGSLLDRIVQISEVN